MPIQPRNKPMAHMTKRTPAQHTADTTNPHEPAYALQIRKAYADGVLHGIARAKTASLYKLVFQSIVLCAVTFATIYLATRALEYAESAGDALQVVECKP